MAVDVLLASFPIVAVIVMMLAFGMPAKKTLPLGWLASLAEKSMVLVMTEALAGAFSQAYVAVCATTA